MNLVYAYPSNLDRTFVRSLQVAQTVNALAKAGVDVYFMKGRSYDGRGEDETFRRFNVVRHENLHIVPIRMFRPSRTSAVRLSWNFVSHYSILLAILRLKARRPVDVVYTRDIKLMKKLIRGRRLIPEGKLVFECHDLRSLSDFIPSECATIRLNRDEEFVLSRVDAVVSISPGLTDVLRRTGLCPRVLTAPSGVDPQVFRPVERRPGGRTVAYIGSLHEWKGVDTVIASMRYVEKDVKLKIIGAEENDSNLNRLRNLIETLGVGGQVEIGGFLPQHLLSEALESAGALVLPLPATSYISSHFTSPLKLFEYMSTGIPIIASDVPALNWILSHGRNALLFRPDDPEGLGAAITEAFSNPSLSEDIAREAAVDVQGYTWEKRGQTIAAFLEGVTRGS